MTSKRLKTQKRNLQSLSSDEFEKFVEEILVKRGWRIYNTQKSNRGGIDIIATKKDNTIGFIKIICQLKRYINSTPVKINVIKELDLLISQLKSTKGLIITTTSLSPNAIKLVKLNRFKMSYIDAEALEYLVSQDEQIDDLLF